MASLPALLTSSPSLLFTQCLQNDFVQPVGRYDVVPNRLHVGFAEALRLMGETPVEGPVARLMRWAAGTSDDVLRVIHIRDWHDGADPTQHAHLERFGSHCIAGSPGAAFAFVDEMSARKDVTLVDTITLNDFSGTMLQKTLAPFAEVPVRAGVVGVWTEAKVSFLCYELITRYPKMEVAVCSALCASSSRQQHFEALDQLDRILGVRVIDSLGEFIDWLGGAASTLALWSGWEARRTLGLPRSVTPVAVIPLGRPRGLPTPAPVPPLGNVVHLDRYGH